MVTRRSATIFGSLLTLLAMIIYAVFRVYILFLSLSTAVGAIDHVVIVSFWMGEMFILFHAIGYFVSIIQAMKSYERPALHYAGKSTPKVDVCIPVHDEPLSIVFPSLVACKYMDYQNFEVFLIDASNDPKNSKQYIAACKAHGFTYYRVPEPRHGAKAGALNTFIREVIRSRYFVVFDADFRPSRDFLKVLVPQMESSPEVAFIQTPQYYGNTAESVVSRASELQQSIFYEYLCEAKSIHGGLFMCGTNLIIRTAAMRGIGGFDESSITEDFATSLKFLRAGWVGRYYNYTAAFGDGPVNLREYFRQQYRWARGTLGLFVDRFAAFSIQPGLNIGQRWEFLLSGSYYFVGLCWLILILLPPVYVFFRVPVYSASPIAYFAAYIPYALLSFALFFITLFGRKYKGKDWIRAESLALLTVPIFAKASIDALLRRKAAFEKTRKIANSYEIPWDQLGPQIFIICFNGAAVVVGAWYLLRGGMDVPLMINVFWSFFHGILLILVPLEIYVKKLSKSSKRTARA